MSSTARNGGEMPAAVTLVCPSMTVRGTLVEGHLFLGGKGLSQFHKTTICMGKAHGDGSYYVTIKRRFCIKVFFKWLMSSTEFTMESISV